MAQSFSPIQIITQVATGLGVPVSLAIAIAQHESGLNPNAVGDNGSSFGLYQLHRGGELGSMAPEQVMGDEKGMFLNAYTALSRVAYVLKQNPSASPGDIAAMAQRPANPGAYAATINALLAGSPNTQSGQGSSFMTTGPQGALAEQLANQPTQSSVALPSSFSPLDVTQPGQPTTPLSPLSGGMVSPLAGGGASPLQQQMATPLALQPGSPLGATSPTFVQDSVTPTQASSVLSKIGNFFTNLGANPHAAPLPGGVSSTPQLTPELTPNASATSAAAEFVPNATPGANVMPANNQQLSTGGANG